jgi:hypothetical protein
MDRQGRQAGEIVEFMTQSAFIESRPLPENASRPVRLRNKAAMDRIADQGIREMLGLVTAE